MKTLVAALLLALPAWTQQDEGVGLADNKGNFYSVTTRRGRNLYVQVTKLTLGGAVLWNVPFDPGVDVTATALAVDREGNLILAGTVAGRRFRDIGVAKFTPFGAFMWRQSHDAGADALPTAVAVDNDGNIVIGASISESNGSRLKVVRFGPMGVFFWGHEFKGGRTNYARYISLDPNGDARVTVETATGDFGRGFAQTRQVLFTTFGAVVPQ